MGLLVSATADKKILIKGTEIELPSVYARLEYSARANGVTLVPILIQAIQDQQKQIDELKKLIE